jgi:hypothetical protein
MAKDVGWAFEIPIRPTTYVAGDFRLGSWVRHQHRMHRKGKLPRERAQRLEELAYWAWLLD